MDQRETPMDILRNLSRKLAPTSKPIRTSSSVSSSSPSVASAGATPSVTGPSRRRTAESSRWSVGTTQPIPEESAGHADYRDDDDEEEELRPPRLSLPIDQDDDDEEELRPPRPSILEDFDYTMNSVEFPRRMDFDQQAAGRLSRGSLGSMRPSDVFDVSQLPVDSPRRQSDFFPEQIAEDVGEFQR